MTVMFCKICSAPIDELVPYCLSGEYGGACHKVCVELERSANMLVDKILNVLEKKNQ